MSFRDLIKFNTIKAFVLFIFCILFLSFQTSTVSAQIKDTINYQTKISIKSTGLNIDSLAPACLVTGSTDSCDFRIRIWNLLSGGTATAGNNLLFEELFTNQEIGDTNGTINLAINSICAATANGTHQWGTSVTSTTLCNLFDDNADADSTTGVNFNRADLYVELTFDPSGTWTTLASVPGGVETFTRALLTSVPSAYVAQSLNGYSSSDFVQLSPTAIQNTTSSTGALRINQQGSGNLLQLQSAGGDKLVVDNNGQLKLATQGSSGGVKLGDSGVIYRSAAGVLTVNNSFEVALNTTINGLSNFRGNIQAIATSSNGSTTTTGTGTATRNLTLTSTTNFNAGNIILLNSTTYARIDSIDSANNMTVTPALTWTAGQTIVEYTVPFVGGDGQAANISQQFNSAFVTNYLKTGGDATGTTYGDKVITAQRGLVIQSGQQSIISTTTNINTSTGLIINKADNLNSDDAFWGVGPAGGTSRYAYSAVTAGTKIYYWGGTTVAPTPLNTMDIFDTATNTWSTGAAGGTARYYAVGATTGSKIYYWGGTTNGTNVINTLDIYDIMSNTWSTGTAGGTAAFGPWGSIFEGKFYIWGGWTGAAVTNVMRIYDITTNSWSTGLAGGTGKVYGPSVIYNGKMYFWGGCLTNTCATVTNALDIYTISTNTWTTGLAGGNARGGGIVTTSGDKLYAVTGYNNTNSVDVVDVYDFTRNSWSAGLAGGTGRANLTGALVSGKLYIWGGTNYTGAVVNTMDILSLPTSSVTPTGNWAGGTTGGTARYGYGTATVGTKIYYWGGTVAGVSAINTVDIFDTSTSTWTTGATGGTGRWFVSSATDGSKIYFWGGTTNGTNVTNTLDIYDIAGNSWSTGTAGGTSAFGAYGALINGKFYVWSGWSGSAWVTNMSIYDIAGNSWTTGTSGGTGRGYGNGGVYNNRIYMWGGCNSASAGCVTTLNTIDIYDIDGNSWTTGTTGGTPRGVASTLIYENYMLTVGGFFNTAGYQNIVDIYNLTTATWSPAASGGIARGNNRASIIGTKIYAWGGINSVGATVNSMDIYNVPINSSDNGRWTTGASGGRVNNIGGSAIYQGKIYFWGGLNGSPTNNLDIYDPTTDTWSAGTSGGTARYYTGNLIVYNNKMYVWGGCPTSCATPEPMDIYDFATDTWSVGATNATPRNRPGGILYNGKIYYWGGYTSPGYVNTMAIYDIATDTWSAGTAGGTARYEYSTVLYNNEMYIFGGHAAASVLTSDVYNFLTNTWSTVASIPAARNEAVATVRDGKAYLHAGSNTNTTDIYDFSTNRWSTGVTGGTTRAFPVGQVYNDKWYIWGGLAAPAIDIYSFNDNSNVLKFKVGDQEKLTLNTDNQITVSGQALGLNYPLKDSLQYSAVAWASKATATEVRYYPVGIGYNGKQYYVNGCNSATGCSTLATYIVIYDPATNTYTNSSIGGTPRWVSNAHEYNGKIYIVTGASNTAGTVFSTAVDIYDIATDTWTTGLSGGTGRYGAASVLYNAKIYIWGGSTGAVSTVMDIYDIKANTWSTGLAGGVGRWLHSAALYNGRIFFWGGVNGAGTLINTLDIYDIQGNTWTTGLAGGTAKRSMYATVYRDRMYIWGGFTTVVINTMNVYDFTTNTWSIPASLTGGTSRVAYGSVFDKGKIFFYGGNDTVNTLGIMETLELGTSKAQDVFYIQNSTNAGPDSGKLFRFDATGRAYTSKQGGWFSVGADYAEYMHVNDTSIVAGDIVKLDKNDAKSLVKTEIKNDPDVIGVISTDPGFVGNISGVDDINSLSPEMRLLSMVGQVPVKVNNENGPIRAGDKITTSSTAGIGMKADDGESNIGIAQENFTAESTDQVRTISVLITRNNDGINNKLQINLGENAQAGFRLAENKKLQYKDADGVWTDISREISTDTSLVWSKIGDNIYNNNSGVVSIGVAEENLTTSKLQIAKDMQVADGLRFIKLSAEGTILIGGLANEIGFRVNNITGSLEYKDALSNDWKGMSGILISRMQVNADDSINQIKNVQQISGWGYVQGDSLSTLLSKEVSLSSSNANNLLVLSNIIGYSDFEPTSPTDCNSLIQKDLVSEVNIIDNNKFNVIIDDPEVSIGNKFACFNWIAIGNN